MSEKTDRSANGQFAAGHAPSNEGKGGRPSRARELAYLTVVAEEVPLEDFRKIVRKAKEDATSGADGRTRDYGRRWIADYLIGRPRQTLHINTSGGERDEFDELSDEELRAIIANDLADNAAADEAAAAQSGAGPRDAGGAPAQTG